MHNKNATKIHLTTEQLKLVSGGLPINIDPNYVSEPLAERQLGFPGEHGFPISAVGPETTPFA